MLSNSEGAKGDDFFISEKLKFVGGRPTCSDPRRVEEKAEEDHLATHRESHSWKNKRMGYDAEAFDQIPDRLGTWDFI